MTTIALTGTVCLYGQLLKNHFVIISNKKISSIGKIEEMPQDFSGQVFHFPEQHTISPGFIDIHIHGAGGADTMDASFEKLDVMAESLVKEGTTAFLPTTITQDEKAIEEALVNVAKYMEKVDGDRGSQAEVVGIHLEGPFINPVRKGAQPEQYILLPSVDKFKQWQQLSGNNIKLVTLAPEREGGSELVQYLAETGVIPSIGHSDADYEEVSKAIELGANHITHLYNGMKGLHHREPGTAGAALLRNELKVEIIADGLHIHPEMINLAVRAKGLDGVILITDSMRAKWLSDGVSELGGQEVFIKDGKATLANGSLAGSILKMNVGIKNMMEFAGLSLSEAIQLATINPAKQISIDDRKGSIEVGKDADLVVLDEDCEVVMTICGGEVAFEREES